MIRISTIFIAICMVLVAASLGLVLHSMAGISGSESAIVALTALTFLILYNAVSMRLRDRTDVGSQIADLSRGTADLARQVAEFGRRLSAVEGRIVWSNSVRAHRLHGVLGEITELGGLMKQLAITVAQHEDLIAAIPPATPGGAGAPVRETDRLSLSPASPGGAPEVKATAPSGIDPRVTEATAPFSAAQAAVALPPRPQAPPVAAAPATSKMTASTPGPVAPYTPR